MNPAVECTSRPSRPRLDLPSSLPARSSGSVNASNVDASTNSPGWRTNASPSVFSTSVVSSSCCWAGSMWVYRWLLNTRNQRSKRTSMLAGCTIDGLNGQMWRRCSARAARRDRSLSSMGDLHGDGGEAVPVEDDDGVDVDIDEEEPVADPVDEDAFDVVAVSEFDEPADWVDGQGCGGELGGDGLGEGYGRGSGSGCGR